jgi:hypothetical protein
MKVHCNSNVHHLSPGATHVAFARVLELSVPAEEQQPRSGDSSGAPMRVRSRSNPGASSRSARASASTESLAETVRAGWHGDCLSRCHAVVFASADSHSAAGRAPKVQWAARSSLSAVYAALGVAGAAHAARPWRLSAWGGVCSTSPSPVVITRILVIAIAPTVPHAAPLSTSPTRESAFHLVQSRCGLISASTRPDYP